jgi:hypothetical protein
MAKITDVIGDMLGSGFVEILLCWREYRRGQGGNFKKNDLLICSYQNQHRIVKDKFDGSVVTNILTSN